MKIYKIYRFFPPLPFFCVTVQLICSVADPDPNPDPDPPDPCLWASWIRIQIHQSEVWILLSPSKKSKENLDFYCFVTFFDFLSLKMMYRYMYLQKVKSKKTF
jgi:hypothetical protein